jgi:hypothetical protein
VSRLRLVVAAEPLASATALAAFLKAFRMPDGPHRSGGIWLWSLAAQANSLDTLLLWRARLAAVGATPLLVRCGFGFGTEDALDSGQAHSRARQALAGLADPPMRRYRSSAAPFAPASAPAAMTAWEDGEVRPLRSALLLHMDALMACWTPAQWQAIALVLEGKRYEAVGSALRITPQNVHKRLKAAGLDLFLAGHAALKANWQPGGPSRQ